MSVITTVERLRKRFVEEGLEVALERHNRKNYTRKLDGDAEAHLIAVIKPAKMKTLGLIIRVSIRSTRFPILTNQDPHRVMQFMKKSLITL